MPICHTSAIFLTTTVPGCRMAHILAEGKFDRLGCTGMVLGEAKVHTVYLILCTAQKCNMVLTAVYHFEF